MKKRKREKGKNRVDFYYKFATICCILNSYAKSVVNRSRGGRR